MKSFKKFILAILLLIVPIGIFSACNKSVEFKINFIVDNEVYDTISTTGNTTISMPDDPIKEGYTFDGWYWDNDVWSRPFTANSLLDTPLVKDLRVYAKFNIIHTHSIVVIDAVEPTCTSSGNQKYYKCFTCNKLFSDENATTEITQIPLLAKLEHNISNWWIVDSYPTCTKTGSKHKECLRCGKAFETTLLEKTNHVPSDWITTYPIVEGYSKKFKSCLECHQILEIVQLDKVVINDIVGIEARVSPFRKLEAQENKLTYSNSFDQNEEIYLPNIILENGYVDGENGVSVEYSVSYNNSECEIKSKKISSEICKYFQANNLGEYKVVIKVKKSNKLSTTVTKTILITENASSLQSTTDYDYPKLILEKDWNSQLYDLNTDIISNSNGASISSDGYLLDSNNEKISINNLSNIYYSPFDQGSTILNIPSMIFESEDENLNIRLFVTDRKGNSVSKVNQEKVSFDAATQTYTISDASFKLSGYGVYTVTYTAKDFSGKTTARSYGIRVNDKTAPTITLLDEDKFGKTIEVGEYFEVPTAVLLKDGEICEGTTSWEIYNTSYGATYELSSNGFIPTSEGTFFIRYTGVDEFGNKVGFVDSLFIVTAKDTIAPNIFIDLTETTQKVIDWQVSDGQSYMEIGFEKAYAIDPIRGNLEVTYTVLDPNHKSVEVCEHKTKDNLMVFRAYIQGTYTIVYIAIDDSGNESKITKTINVGDCEKPILTWINNERDLIREINVGESYELKVEEFLILQDNVTSVADLKKNLKITLTSPSGYDVVNELQGEGYKWTFDSLGLYGLKIVVRDNVGNAATYSYTINAI